MTETIQALIVDDEELGRANLRFALAAYPKWGLVAECNSTQAALQQLKQAAIDVVFLDIRMPNESGLGLAKTLSQLDEPPLIIFVTAYQSYAVEAFEVHALDYLLKPFDDQRFAQALERAESLLLLRQKRLYGSALRECVATFDAESMKKEPAFLQKLTIRSTGKIEVVELDQIQWFSSAGNYVELHMNQKTLLHRQPLSQLEKRLDPNFILRVHRSALVRRDQMSVLSVTGDGTYELGLRNGENVAVSERYVNSVREAMKG